jgi:HK97 family phage major capsid protein
METKDLDVIKSAIGEGVKPLNDTVIALKAVADGLDVKFKGIEERISKIEALPAISAPAFNRISTKYRGYDIEEQGEVLRKSMKQNRYLNTEERINDYSKFMIAMIKAIKGDQSARADYLEMFKKTAMIEGTDGYGGYLVPTEYQWDMIKLSRAKSFGLQNCMVLDMSSDTLMLPKEASLVAVNWSGEVAMTESEPTLDQVELDAKDLDGYAIVSI